MGGQHNHEVTATGEHRKRLIVVLVTTCAVLIVEVIGGPIAGSLALLADAGHMLTDSTGLIWHSSWPRSRRGLPRRGAPSDCSAPRCWRPWAMPCYWSGLPLGADQSR